MMCQLLDFRCMHCHFITERVGFEFKHRRGRDHARDIIQGFAYEMDLEDSVETPITIAETRIRPLADPMKMNGCALALVSAPAGFDEVLRIICGWVAAGFGNDGRARVWTAAS